MPPLPLQTTFDGGGHDHPLRARTGRPRHPAVTQPAKTASARQAAGAVIHVERAMARRPWVSGGGGAPEPGTAVGPSCARRGDAEAVVHDDEARGRETGHDDADGELDGAPHCYVEETSCVHAGGTWLVSGLRLRGVREVMKMMAYPHFHCCQ